MDSPEESAADSGVDDGELQLKLTADEKRLLVRSWSILEKRHDALAVKIFQMIFDQCPEAKTMFRFPPSDYDSRKSQKSNEFIFHSRRFLQMIKSMVESLEQDRSVAALLANVGSVHGRLKSKRGFHSYYWAVFTECVLYQFRQALQTATTMREQMDEAIIAWRHLLAFMIRRMTAGFEADLRNRESVDNRRHPPMLPKSKSLHDIHEQQQLRRASKPSDLHSVHASKLSTTSVTPSFHVPRFSRFNF